MTDTVPRVSRPAPINSSRRWEIGIMILVLACMFLLCPASWKWRKSLRVQSALIDGEKVVSSSQISALAGLQLKSPLSSTDLYAIRRGVLMNPFIEGVRISRQYPDVVHIRVKERQPVASLNSGGMFYVDLHGILLPPVQSGKSFDLPIISGVAPLKGTIPGDAIRDGDVLAAIELLEIAREIDPTLYHFISEVNMNHGKDVILYSTDLAVPIYIGRHDIAFKLLTLQTFWNKIVKASKPEQLQYIDLRFADQVVIRLQESRQSSSRVTL